MGQSRTYREKPPQPEPLGVAVVDNHTHFDISRDGNTHAVRDVIDEAVAVGVNRMVQIGCDLPGARFTASVVDEFPELLGGVALHPNEVPKLHAEGTLDAAYAEIADIAQHPRIRVVGETGLDYFRTEPDGIEVQQAGFRWHIALAKKLVKALQIHDRDAHADVMRILSEEGAPDVTVLHCFSGDTAMARECVERGYFVSVSGVLSFKNAQELRDAIAEVPVENLLVETDAPYLTPAPFRGAVNAPYLIPLTVRALAEVKGVEVDYLCEQLSANSERAYGSWA